MPVCPKCRSEFERGADWCAACDAVLLDVVSAARPTPIEPGERAATAHARGNERPGGAPEGRLAVRADPLASDSSDERLILLIEEPLPEMAEMICEFLQNCGIRSVVHSESIGLLYRLPAPGAPISRSRVYVFESDYQEAREVVAHFFDRK